MLAVVLIFSIAFAYPSLSCAILFLARFRSIFAVAPASIISRTFLFRLHFILQLCSAPQTIPRKPFRRRFSCRVRSMVHTFWLKTTNKGTVCRIDNETNQKCAFCVPVLLTRYSTAVVRTSSSQKLRSSTFKLDLYRCVHKLHASAPGNGCGGPSVVPIFTSCMKGGGGIYSLCSVRLVLTILLKNLRFMLKNLRAELILSYALKVYLCRMLR